MGNVIMDKERLVNYVTMIKNINKVTGQCSYIDPKIDVLIDVMINKASKYAPNSNDLTYEIISILGDRQSQSVAYMPMNRIYNYYNCNIYAQLIIFITKNSFTISERWEIEDSYENTWGIEKNKSNARKLVKLFKESEDDTERYRFIFWALMILTVDKTDVKEHLSLICDYAKMLDITDDEFEDIIRTIKIIYNQEESYNFRTETIPAYFKNLFDLMKIHID